MVSLRVFQTAAKTAEQWVEGKAGQMVDLTAAMLAASMVAQKVDG